LTFPDWLRVYDSNVDLEVQGLGCYRYTNPEYLDFQISSGGDGAGDDAE